MGIMKEAKVLKHMLTREVVSLDADGFTSPQEVITYSGRLLEKAGKVTEQYVKDMVSAYEMLGPYIVMAPGLAMPMRGQAEM